MGRDVYPHPTRRSHDKPARPGAWPPAACIETKPLGRQGVATIYAGGASNRKEPTMIITCVICRKRWQIVPLHETEKHDGVCGPCEPVYKAWLQIPEPRPPLAEFAGDNPPEQGGKP